jgi:uncharacterized protein involved in exopolysaccharide biosynthesis
MIMQGTSPNGPGDRRPAPDEISLVALANAILHRRRLVAWSGLALFAVVVSATLLQGRVYTAAASFIPQSGQVSGGLSTIAAQFGLALPIGEATQSPDFYADLVRSREVLSAVVDDRYSFRADTGAVTGTLLNIFRIEGRDSALRQEKGIRALGGVVSTGVDKRTGVIRVAATTRYPALSQQITQNIVDEVNRFDLERRQARAAAEREFMEQRVKEVRADLRAAEDRLQAFLLSNRQYRDSPVLTFQTDRLTRDVNMQQQVYTSLSQAVEQARIEAMRDTPVIMVVDRPAVPARPDPRGLLPRGMIALVAGLVAGMVLAIIAGRLDKARGEEPSAYGELYRLRADLLADLRRPWRLFRSGARPAA